MKQKRILMLGGSVMQVPVIVKAKQLGHYVITCDYKPDNPGHKFADEYHNVSTTDREAVYELAKKLNIDGVVCYMSDVSAPIAAYVCEKLGLPTSPYESVYLLTHKDLFRKFLRENNFNCPRSEGFASLDEALPCIKEFRMPVMVKPTDSAGSKGVSKITDPAQLPDAVKVALSYSISKRFIIEEYVEMDGYQVAGDGFSVDGELKFRCFMDEHFSQLCHNPFVPVGETAPMNRPAEVHQKIHDEIQRVLRLLKMKTQAYNFDIRIDSKGEVWLMEIGPRNGGNMIAQIIENSTGVPYVEWIIKAALGEDCSKITQVEPNQLWASYVVHSNEAGRFLELRYSDDIKKNVCGQFLNVSIGDEVRPFSGSDWTLGVLLLKFDTIEDMCQKIDFMEKYITVVVA